MGFFDTDSFLTGLAAGVKQSLDEASRKRDEAEKQRQTFLQALQLKLLEQIPEIEKNVYAGKSDPASAAASLQRLQTQGMAQAPRLPPEPFPEALAHFLTGGPAEATTPAVDITNIAEQFAQVQKAGEAQRVKKTAVEIEVDKQKTQNRSDIQLLRQEKIEGVRQRGRETLEGVRQRGRETLEGVRHANRQAEKNKDQASRDTAMKKNVEYATQQFQDALGLDPKAARIEAIKLVLKSDKGANVSANAVFGALFNGIGGYNLKDPKERAEAMALYNQLMGEVGAKSLATKAAVPSPTAPAPGGSTVKQKLEALIAGDRQRGLKDRDIARELRASKAFQQSGLSLQDLGIGQ